jgi:pilus assembly protein Flp/PilA
MNRLLARFFTDETGATAIEYALIASGIAVVIVGAVQGLGTSVNDMYGSVLAAMK